MSEKVKPKITMGSFDFLKGLAMIALIVIHMSYYDFDKNMIVDGNKTL